MPMLTKGIPQTGQFLIQFYSLRTGHPPWEFLSDAEWELVGQLLPTAPGCRPRLSFENRCFPIGMVNMLRVVCPWRDRHERQGKWNSIYTRLRHWDEQGDRNAPLQTPVDFSLTAVWQHMIDCTKVCDRVRAVGARGGLPRRPLVDQPTAQLAKSTLAVTIRVSLSALS